VSSLLFFFFVSVRQIKLALRQRLGALEYSVSYRIHHQTLEGTCVAICRQYPALNTCLYSHIKYTTVTVQSILLKEA